MESFRTEGGKRTLAFTNDIFFQVASSGIATTPEEVEKYASCTMLAASIGRESQSKDKTVTKCLQFLEENEFIRCPLYNPM
jgi:hypothetical protein